MHVAIHGRIFARYAYDGAAAARRCGAYDNGFLIGFAIAQLVWGPISDRIGRKIPLFIDMAIFAIESVGCAMSDTMASVVFWRVFQTVGACVGPMLSRAMISDLFGSSQAAQMLSTLVIIVAIAPIAGPLLGGAILEFGSWHGIFWLMALASAVMFAMIFFSAGDLAAVKALRKAHRIVF